MNAQKQEHRMTTTDYDKGYAKADDIFRGYDLMSEDEQCTADYRDEMMLEAFENDPLNNPFSEEYIRGYKEAKAYWTEETEEEKDRRNWLFRVENGLDGTETEDERDRRLRRLGLL